MRTTVRIDDDLMRELNEKAHQEGLSLTRLINRVLRQGMGVLRQATKPVRPYREKTFRMGQPRVDLTKAIALAASLEDSEVREKLARRK
jgi:hypothetical protein